VQLFVEATGVANWQAVAVAAPQRGRDRVAVGAHDAGFFNGCLFLLKIENYLQIENTSFKQ
jgi:hypothetical protein